MARRSRKPPARRTRSEEPAIADQVLDAPDATVLDLLDHLLNKGVMLNADVTLGVAGIDLIYLRLSAMLCAADRILPFDPEKTKRRRRRRQLRPPRAKRLT